MYDQMSDADLVKMARGTVPPHMQMALMQALQGRVKKYADGGLVKNVGPEDVLKGYDVETLKSMLLSGAFTADVNKLIQAEIASRSPQSDSGLMGMLGEAEKRRAADIDTRTRDARVMSREGSSTASDPPKPARSPLEIATETLRKKGVIASSPIAKAAAEPAPQPQPERRSMPESVIDRASRQAMPSPQAKPRPQPQPQRRPQPQPRMAEPDLQPPPMRPEAEPQQPSAIAKAAESMQPPQSGKKEPPTWASPLMTAGFAMLASRSPNFGNALGEAGLAFMSQAQQEETLRRRMAREATQDARAERELAQGDRRLGIEDRRATTDEQYRRDQMDLQNRQFGAESPLRAAQAEYYRAQAANAGQMRQAGQQQAQLMALAERAANGDATAARQLELLGKRDTGDMLTGLQKMQIDVIKSDAMMPADQKMRLIQQIMGGGAVQGANPLGYQGGGISQGGQRPDPAGIR